jgi:hypothetical protein
VSQTTLYYPFDDVEVAPDDTRDSTSEGGRRRGTTHEYLATRIKGRPSEASFAAAAPQDGTLAGPGGR